MEVVSFDRTDPASNTDTVQIHYIGYSAAYDEWRPRSDIVNLESSRVCEKVCLHEELALRVKSSLVSQRKSNPAVKIEISLDKSVYEEGLNSASIIR